MNASRVHILLCSHVLTFTGTREPFRIICYRAKKVLFIPNLCTRPVCKISVRRNFRRCFTRRLNPHIAIDHFKKYIFSVWVKTPWIKTLHVLREPASKQLRGSLSCSTTFEVLNKWKQETILLSSFYKGTRPPSRQR